MTTSVGMAVSPWSRSDGPSDYGTAEHAAESGAAARIRPHVRSGKAHRVDLEAEAARRAVGGREGVEQDRPVVSNQQPRSLALADLDPERGPERLDECRRGLPADQR